MPKPPPRVRVEGAGKRAAPSADRERVAEKWATTTEALTAEERDIIAGYRLSLGGEVAAQERRRIERRVGEEGWLG